MQGEKQPSQIETWLQSLPSVPPPHRPALSPFRGWRLEERTGLRIQGVAGWGSSRVSLRYSLLALVPRSLPHPISLPACPHS